MTSAQIATILAVAVPTVGGTGYGAKIWSENTFVDHSDLTEYVTTAELEQQFIKQEIIDKQESIDELEWTQENERSLTDKEKWQLKRSKSRVDELKRDLE